MSTSTRSRPVLQALLLQLAAMLTSLAAARFFLDRFSYAFDIFFGAGLLVISLGLYLALGKRTDRVHVPMLLLNSIACGITVNGFYYESGFTFTLAQTLPVALGFWLVIATLYVITRLTARHAVLRFNFALVALVLLVLLAVLSVWWIGSPRSPIHSYGFFTILSSLTGLACLYQVALHDRPPLRLMVIGSYVTYFFTTVSVIIILIATTGSQGG